ncbi:MAG: D-inositol-3-phosphate glycosyltransferase [Deltaproteobacteria bacterium]
MRHLLVSFHTCPFEEPGAGLAGGMNIFLRGHLAGLSARGIETDVLTRATGDRPVLSRPRSGVRILHLPCGWSDPPTRGSAFACLPRFVEEARRLLAAEAGAYDVVSAHYWMSGAAALRLIGRTDRKAPLLVVYHTVEAGKRVVPAEERGPLGEIRHRTEEDLAAAADRVVCFTAEDRERTEAIFPALRGRGVVIPPGVDDRFRTPPSREEGRRRLGIPDAAALFLLAARADPGKELSAAVEAVASARSAAAADARLLVAGQAPPEGGLPDGIRYAGTVAHSEMPLLYAASDAVLAPSLYESFGFVPLEAMAAGTPVIVPDNGYWGRRIAAGGGGIAYPAGDPDGLRNAVLSLLREPARARAMAEEGRRIAEEFTWGRCTEAWAVLLSSVSRSGNRR